MKTQYPLLFTPFKIGNLEIKNRFHMAAMGGNDHITNTGIQDKMKNYYLERARGGFGLLSTGTITIRWHEDRYIAEEQFLTEDVDEVLFKSSTEDWLKAIHAFGAKMMMQISVGTTPCQIPGTFSPTIACNSITKEEIQYYVKRYADAAKLCKDAGFDMVEVHSVHTGYILDQFSTASTNQRTDEYGGSLENRARFGIEILKAIKAACGEDYPVSLKIGGTSAVYDRKPDGTVNVLTRGIDETVELCKLFAEAGYDCLNVDGCRNNSIYTSQDTNLEYWKVIKDAVDIPVIAAGSMANPDLNVHMIENGYCDGISLGRQSLCDPHYVNKLKANKLEDIRFCLRCNAACITNSLYGYPVTCAINPTAGSDAQTALIPATEKKKVFVIGGGLGGMEAAITASRRGHDVTLFEKRDELGGLFIAAAAFDFKEPDKKLLAWYKTQLAKTSVQVCLNTEVTAEMIHTQEPDVVIVATGSDPIVIKVPGYDGENVISLENACLKKAPIGQKVSVIGGGMSGCELAAQLASEGKEVTVIEMLPTLMAKQDRPVAMSTNALIDLMKKYKVDIRTSTRLKEIKSDSVVAETAEGDVMIPSDTVVMGVGFRENNTLFKQLQDYAGEVNNIGDSEHFSNIYHAIWQGYDVACGI